MKRVSTVLALVMGTFVSFSSAAQVQGFISGYAPGTIDEKIEKSNSHLDVNSDFMWALGAEFLTNPVDLLMVGGGVGYFSMQKDGGDKIVMPAFPVFLSISAIGPEKWTVRPYVGARVGYPIPATKFTTWWDKPQHFFVTGNIGVQLPYHMGVEFDCTYLTMDKYIKKTDENYRLSTVKFGGSITVHFDLFKNSAVSDDSSADKDAVAAEPTADNSTDTNNPYDAGDNTEYTDPYASNSDPYADQPAEDSMTGEPAEEPGAEPASEEMPAEETAAEPAAEETPAEEPDAENAVAETPSEEPAAESAPEPAPEQKPAAKKTASKKKSAKKATKKAPAKKKAAKKKAAKKKATAKKSSKKKK